VGHESDVSIADFVADERAATPSMAAEIVVPDRRDVESRIRDLHGRLHDRVVRNVREARQRIDALVSSRAFHSPVRRLEQRQQQLDTLIDRLERGGERVLDRARTRIERLRGRLQAVDPEQPLRRGYAYPTRDDGTPVDAAEALQAGDLVDLRFEDGTRRTEVLPDED
jgi:exodeoxyribonuclease VII large subunit